MIGVLRMAKYILSEGRIKRFELHLREEERSEHTIGKYVRDIRAFRSFLAGRELSKELVLAYKLYLSKKYKPASVNSMLAALKSFFTFCGWPELRVKSLKVQKRMFAEPERVLTAEEYNRLLVAAKSRQKEQLCLLMQTICATGIRVSELSFITVEAARLGRAEVSSKGKQRTVFMTPKLKILLLSYAKRRGITTGHVFVSRNGIPLNRHRIWAEMKKLCQEAEVDAAKVFPHNLRHLFARTFYSIEKDLSRLADILGHSNIDTTRIYTMECGDNHMRIMKKMPLLL